MKMIEMNDDGWGKFKVATDYSYHTSSITPIDDYLRGHYISDDSSTSIIGIDTSEESTCVNLSSKVLELEDKINNYIEENKELKNSLKILVDKNQKLELKFKQLEAVYRVMFDKMEETL